MYVEGIQPKNRELLHHPNYMLDLASSDYRLFGFIKDQTWGQQYVTNKAVQGFHIHLKITKINFHHKGIFRCLEQ